MFKEMVSRFLAGVLAIVMGAAAPMSPEVPVGGSSTEQLERPENSTFSIRFIDVGQADSALVECDGHYMLIDGGNVDDSRLIYSVLKDTGVLKLDIVVGTHPHE